MDKNVLELVASIEKGNFDTAVDVLIQQKPENRAKVLAGTIDLMNMRNYELKKQLENALAQLARHEELEDKFAHSFIDGIVFSITDPSSALRAASLYSAEWFADLEFSKTMKIAFCQRLIDTVSQFNPSYVSNLWVNVVNGVPVALNAITFQAPSFEE